MRQLKVLILVLISGLFTMCQSNCDVIELKAIEDFDVAVTPDFVPFYVDDERSALALDAAQFKNQFALANYTFAGSDGEYLASIQTLSEDDGESQYRLYINDSLIKEVQNDPMEQNYVKQSHDFKKIALTNGDTIGVAFSSHTNGKIPEGVTTAYSRGRWTALILRPVCE
ncbi:hypothetical protein B0O79_1418 [Flavobacteriaceae bacterium MAR_2009_75]|nr:hypothetical protein B0O79_1418 [Flavobacteriaceae bacterium MAR_2009_75]